MLLGCMTDDVSIVADPETQCHDIAITEANVLGSDVSICTTLFGCYMHHVVRLHDRRSQHCCGAKVAIP